MITMMKKNDYSDNKMIAVMIHRNQKASQLQWDHSNQYIGNNKYILYRSEK